MGRLLGALGLAWLVPILTHAVGVDWLLVPLVIVGTAALLRGGRALLDRLMLAIALLLGVVCAAGLVFTVWPFGLSPVATAGTALTLLVITSALTHRRPRLPRPSGGDVPAVLGALAVGGYLAWPFATTDTTGRLTLALLGEDGARHATAFDAVRRMGGYLFWESSGQLPEVWQRMRFYPQGWHLTAGLLDGFARSSSTELGTPASAIEHHFAFSLVFYGLLVLAVMWAAQYVAGPLLGWWQRLVVVGLLGMVCLNTSLPSLLFFGFPSEVLGLALLALLVAVLARPVSDAREQLLLVAALLIALAYTYYLFVPAAGLAVVVWLVRDRRVWRHRGTFALTAVVGGAIALVPMVVGLVVAGHGTNFTSPGGIIPFSRFTMVVLGAVVLATLLRKAGRRLRVWRSYRWTLGVMALTAAAVGAYQINAVGHTTYYFEKALHALAITLLVGAGAIALLVPFPRQAIPAAVRSWAGTSRPRAALAAVAAATVLAIGGGVALVAFESPFLAEKPARKWGGGVTEQLYRSRTQQILAADQEFPYRDDMVTVIVGDDRYVTYIATLLLSALQRSSRDSAEAQYEGLNIARTPQDVERALLKVTKPVRVITTSDCSGDIVADIQQRHPEARLTSVRLRLPAAGASDRAIACWPAPNR